MLVLQDVTMFHNYQEELKRLSEYKDELLATVSHDLKTPLNSIISSLTAMRGERDSQKIEQLTDTAIKNSLLLDFFISDILDYSMISKGVLRIQPQLVDLQQVVNFLFDISREQASYKGI
jgi:signal transduction histidine kinase